MLTNRSRYALKALLVLAREAGQGPILVADLAAREALPKKFLEAILLDLKRQRLVESKKGKGGGYFLRRNPSEITFAEVIRVLDGPLAAGVVREPDRVHAVRGMPRRTDVRRATRDEEGSRRHGRDPGSHHTGGCECAACPP